VPKTRVLIFAMPRLLDDILESVFEADPAVTVVRWPDESSSVGDAAAATEADVVLVGGRRAGTHEVDDLLHRVPHVRALAVAEDARTAVLYELRPDRRLLGELSPAAVLSAVHHARRRQDLFFEPRPAP
jgi:hypothetical protein